MKLSDKLIALRKERGWSQEDFAQKLDISRQAVSRWENGTALPDALNILGISKLFGVTADYLLNDDCADAADASVVAAGAEAKGAEPAEKKTKRTHWYLIPIICFIILSAFAVYQLVKSANESEVDVHAHSEVYRVRENEVAPTCTTEGTYDEVIYCAECGDEIMRTTKNTAKLAHTLSGSVKENEVAPTCKVEGTYDEVIYCAECGDEIMRTTKNTAKLAHTLSGSVKENEVAPTCKVEGTYDEVVYCYECGDEVLRTHRRTDKIDHQYQNGKCIVCEKYMPSEGLVYLSNGDGTCIVDGGTCTDENIVIPEYSPSGDLVISIKAYAFAGRKSLKSVRIPETVTHIGEAAFDFCENLESINLPSKITRINSYTFKDCKSLKEITIPDNVYYIGIEAFENCVSCMSIVIPANVTKIGKDAFKNFSSCDGTVTFEVHNGWVLYDNMGEMVDIVDFANSPKSPTTKITFSDCEYWWRLEPEYTMWSTGRAQ